MPVSIFAQVLMGEYTASEYRELARPLRAEARPEVVSASAHQAGRHSVVTMPEAASSQKSWEEQLKDIAKEYNWEEKVVTFMLNKETGLGAERLADFLDMVTDKSQIASVVSQIPDLKNPLQQRSRIVQAWEGMSKAAKQDEERKHKRPDDTDLDVLLPQGDLDNLSDSYFFRYHVSWMPHIAPADSLVSRLV